MLSSIVGMGLAGFAGVKLTPISMSAPIVILTLAVADSIHILLSLRGLMREGMAKRAALIEAVRINFLPVTITSLTTMLVVMSLFFLGGEAVSGFSTALMIGIVVGTYSSIYMASSTALWLNVLNQWRKRAQYVDRDRTEQP